MRINNVGGGVDTNLIDRIMDGERAPVEAAKTRRERVVDEKNEYSAFAGMLEGLGTVASGMRQSSGFARMAFDSSHPDILQGMVDGAAQPGNYEFEVRGLAKADKHLDVGFPDVDKTPVGFGFIAVQKDDGSDAEVVINPGSTLQDAAAKINDAKIGVRASIINTGVKDEPFRLLVASEKTGEASKISIDADTTILNFKNIKAASNLDVLFEDVEVTGAENHLNDLLTGVKIDAKRAEPGTRVTVNVRHDIDKTAEGVKALTEKYNEIARYANDQFHTDPSTKRGGKLAGDGNLRTVMRGLQTEISKPQANATGTYKSLAEIGVKTNAKTGELEIDDTKLKAAMTKDYDSVASLFVSGEHGEGVAARLANVIRNFNDPMHGPVKNRLRSLDQSIKSQDQSIERQTTRLADREAALQKQFSALQSKVANLNAQGDFLSARFGGDTSGPQG